MQICGIIKYENLLKFSQFFSPSKMVAKTPLNVNIFCYLFLIHMQSLPTDPLRTQPTAKRIFVIETESFPLHTHTGVRNRMDTTYSLSLAVCLSSSSIFECDDNKSVCLFIEIIVFISFLHWICLSA